MNPKVEASAVVRYDQYATAHTDDPGLLITVVAVVPTQDEAVSEVERLTKLKGDKPVTYFWQYAPFFPDGRGIRKPNQP